VAGRWTAAILAAALLTGCGRAGGRPSVCAAGARTAVAGRLGVPASAVSQRVSTGNNAMPQCVLTARRPAAAPVVVTVNVDTGPQPYFRLERTAVEAAQQFGTVRLYAPPQQISGLGLDADWFPDGDYAMTTDGRRLITATIGWPRSSQAQRRALAETAARSFLGAPRRRAATGYPSG
jgi:hypothetical protein